MSVAVLDKKEVERKAERSTESVRRPRVLHLINSFEIGGTERQAAELLKRLDQKRYDVRLAALRNCGPFYKEIEEHFLMCRSFRSQAFTI